MSSGSEEDAGRTGRKAGRTAPEAGAGDRTTCTPCRGTGQLISNLGGEAHQVTCPWCGGSGRFTPGRDGQEHPAEQG